MYVEDEGEQTPNIEFNPYFSVNNTQQAVLSNVEDEDWQAEDEDDSEWYRYVPTNSTQEGLGSTITSVEVRNYEIIS